MTDSKCYLKCHKSSGLQVGDRVKILRKAKHYEQGWDCIWSPRMDRYVGQVAHITGDALSQGFVLSTNGYYFPWFVLEQLEPDCVKINLTSGQTLRIHPDRIQCGSDTIHLNTARAFESLLEHRYAVHRILAPVRPRRDLGLLDEYRVEIFPVLDRSTLIRIGPIALTYNEFEQVCKVLTHLRNAKLPS